MDRLEKALEVFGDYNGPELAGLKQALKKARELAQKLPIDVQITQCKEFIEQRERPCQKRGGTHHQDEVAGRRSCTVWSQLTIWRVLRVSKSPRGRRSRMDSVPTT